MWGVGWFEHQNLAFFFFFSFFFFPPKRSLSLPVFSRLVLPFLPPFFLSKNFCVAFISCHLYKDNWSDFLFERFFFKMTKHSGAEVRLTIVFIFIFYSCPVGNSQMQHSGGSITRGASVPCVPEAFCTKQLHFSFPFLLYPLFSFLYTDPACLSWVCVLP